MSVIRVRSSQMNPLTMLGKSSRLTLGTQVGAVLNFAVSMVVARTLGPEQLGAVSLVTLALLYASFMRLGIFEGGERELIDRLGKGQSAEAERVQRLALTGDLLWSLLPAVGLFAMAFAFDEPIRRAGFLLAPLMYLGTTLYRMLMRLYLARQRFDVVAPVNAIRAIGQPLLVLGLLHVAGPFSLLIAPLVLEWLLAAVYLLRAPSLDLRPAFERREIRRLIGIGLPLALMGLVYWTYRLVGAATVATFLPVRDLGFYNFVSGPINLILVAFAEFSAVLAPTLWAELGRTGAAEKLSRECARVTVFITLAACVLVNFAQAGFHPFVQLVAPAFTPAVPVFDVLAFNIVLLTVTFVPGLILDSAVVNRQWLHLAAWLAGLVVNIGANLLAVRLGWGMLAIALNDVWVQLLVVAIIFGLAQRFVFKQRGDALRLYGVLSGLLLLCVLSLAAMRVIPLQIGMELGGLAIATAARVGIVVVVWLAPVVWLLRTMTASAVEPAS